MYQGYSNSETIPNVISTVQDIPNYDDSGVSYKGKFKIKKGENDYELKAQATRFFSCEIPLGSAAGTYSFTRGTTNKFYFTNITVQSNVATSPTHIIIYDDVTSNPKGKFIVSNDPINFSIDIKDSPRMFAGTNILINIDAAVGAVGNFLHVIFYGWEEQQ